MKQKRPDLVLVFGTLLILTVAALTVLFSVKTGRFLLGTYLFFGETIFLVFFFEYMGLWIGGMHSVTRLVARIGFPMCAIFFGVLAVIVKSFDAALYAVMMIALFLLIEGQNSGKINIKLVRFVSYAVSVSLLFLYSIKDTSDFPDWLSKWLGDKDDNFVYVAVVMFMAFDKMISEFYKMLDAKKEKLHAHAQSPRLPPVEEVPASGG